RIAVSFRQSFDKAWKQSERRSGNSTATQLDSLSVRAGSHHFSVDRQPHAIVINREVAEIGEFFKVVRIEKGGRSSTDAVVNRFEEFKIFFTLGLGSDVAKIQRRNGLKIRVQPGLG